MKTIMEILDLFEKDYHSEGFSVFEMVMFGIFVPIMFIVVCILASALV